MKNFLLENLEIVKEMIDQVQDIFFVLNLDGTFKYLNKYGLNLLEAQDVELETLTVDKIIAKEYRDEVKQKIINKVKGLETEAFYMTKIISSTGKEVPIELSSQVLKKDGKPFLIFGTGRNLSKREIYKKELIQLRLAVQELAEGVVLTDRNNIIQFVNPAFSKITGYNFDEAVGQSPRILKSGETKPELYKELWKTLKSGKSWKGVFINKHKSGKVYQEEDVISSIKNHKNEITGYIAIKKDISERKKMEEKTLHSNKLEAIGTLAAGIAHEINTPLQFISDNFSFLESSSQKVFSFIQEIAKTINKETVSEDIKKQFKQLKEEYQTDFLLTEKEYALKDISSGLERIKKIISAMRTFSHTNRTNEKSWNDLNKAIDSTITITTNRWKYDCDLDFFPDENLKPVFCQIDSINQVILNLIVNGADAIHELRSMLESSDFPAEKGKITIKTYPQDNFAVIEVSDTGTGIPQHIVDKIFDPFFTTKEVGKGTGQGLSISRQIVVDEHNGDIEVQTKPGKGTTFIIKLPFNCEELK